MTRHRTHSHQPFYPRVLLRPVPFPLPPAFLHLLGYDRIAGALGSVPAGDDRQPRRFAALWWDAEADRLGWSDGLRRGVGQLDDWVWSGWLHGERALGKVGAWLYEQDIRLEDDDSGRPPADLGLRYWLIVDGEENRAWALIHGLGRKVLRRQQLEPTRDELAEIDELADDPTLSDFYL